MRGTALPDGCKADTLLGMTEYTRYEVAAYKLWVANRTLEMLGVDEGFLDLPELLERIQQRDAKAAEKLDTFFKAYDAWYELSANMIADEAFRRDHQDEILDRISDRDNERQALLVYLNRAKR
ncbi:MAG TPA: hypothetical protein VFA33_22480 [Bryobacteraceae bacterium]|nr:hypothetical protein [Bryobacteraceae bacterium]